MSNLQTSLLTKEQTAELVLKHLDAGEMPILLNTKSLTAFLLNMELNDPLLTEKANFVSNALYKIKIRFSYDIKKLKDIGLQQRYPGKPYSPYLLDIIKIHPQLLIEISYLPNDLREHCYKILGTKTKQLRPFTSEEFESSFAVGAIVRIRLSKDKNIKRTQLAEIEYKPDSESQIQSVTFGGKEYTLPELKDNLEYWRHDHWLPFGVYE